MKAVAKLRDHNYERESPKTKEYFHFIAKKYFDFTLKTPLQRNIRGFKLTQTVLEEQIFD